MNNIIKLSDITRLSDYTGKTVSVTGKISDTPWQHIIGSFASYPFSYYFDVGSYQTVVYSKEEIDCVTMLALKGDVIEVGTKSKKPGEDKDYREYHILVDEWKCE